MREIKFRAWDGKCMLPDIDIMRGKAIRPSHSATFWSDDAKAGTPMQFTGLLDRNGKEIYEGDICRFAGMMAKVEGIGPVYWSEEGAMFCGKVNRLPFVLHKATDVEVIGNIYENPELLEGN